MGRRSRLLILVLLAALLAVAPRASPVEAGGTWLDPVADRYEAGESVTMVGYLGGNSWTERPAFYGYLYKETTDGIIHPRAIPLFVGELELEATGLLGWQATRIAISFDLPTWAQPGTYRLSYCNDGCDRQLGSLIGGIFYVGIDAEYPVTRDWPADEREIANLEPSAQLSLLGTVVTAAELRRDQTAARATQASLDDAYVECVRARGFDQQVSAQVLTTDAGVPYHVKTSPNVPAKYHGQCFAAIGGAATDSSSWNQSVVCDPIHAVPPCGS